MLKYFTFQNDYTIQEVLLQPVTKRCDNAWSSYEQTTEASVDDTVECWVFGI